MEQQQESDLEVQESLKEDELLITQVQKSKDPEAFGRLYDKYYAQIYRFLLYRTTDEDLAKDITSETFFQALQSIWRFRWQNKPFSSWLYKIAYNQFLLSLRRRKHYCPLTLEEAPELIADSEQRQDYVLLQNEQQEERVTLYQRLRTAMKFLPERQQSILILRYFAKKSIQEIADIVRMPAGTVKSHIHRSTKKLGLILSEMTQEGSEKMPLPVQREEERARVSLSHPIQNEM